jgi:hypothetical protein
VLPPSSVVNNSLGEAGQEVLDQLVRPRLFACLSSALSSSTDAGVLAAKLDALLPPVPAPAADSAGGGQHGQQQDQRLRMQLGVLADLLMECVPSWPSEIVAESCRRITAWVLTAAGSGLGTWLLLSGAPAAELGQGEEGTSVCAAAMQDMHRMCLGGVVACCAALGHDAQDKQQEILAELNRQGESWGAVCRGRGSLDGSSCAPACWPA